MMTQCPALRQLTAEHGQAADALRRLRRAAEAPGILEEETRRFLAVWHKVVVLHHRKEEEVLLPELARRIPEGDALILLPLADHVGIRKLVRQIEGGPDERRREVVVELAERLAEHIRFEEDNLYPALEETLGRSRLSELTAELSRCDTIQARLRSAHRGVPGTHRRN